MTKKVLIAGASGMIGSIILQLCLDDEQVSSVICPVRKPTTLPNPKLKEIILEDFSDYSSIDRQLLEIDVIYFCLGVYTGAVDRDTFRKITVDYPMALVNAIGDNKSNTVFCLLSGQGADRTEKSQLMFAKDKGIVENLLSKAGLKAFYSFRPGYIYPSEPRNEPNFSYRLMRMLYPLIKMMGSKFSITSKELANAMYIVGMQGWKEEVLENKDILAVKN